MSRLKQIYSWLDHRLQLGKPLIEMAEHPIPNRTASWWYVFGSAAFTLLLLQIVTGILLALVYVPSAGEAWNSLNFLNHQLTLGWFLRAMHGWGSNFMVAVVLIHMAQVFLFGAYKYPREFTWTLGVFLLLMTLGMAFTGQVMRFDQDAYWGLGIGASIVSRVPWVGGSLVHMMLGGPIIAGATLSRFFTLHVFVIPGLMLVFTFLHVWMVLKLGINEWPMPGRVVRRSTYMAEYHELTTRDGLPFVPGGVWKDAVFSAAIIAAVAVCAVVFGPFGPSGQPDPTIIQTVPKPDFFFLWLYAVLSYLPPSLETPFLLIAPVLGIAALLGLPFYAAEGEKKLASAPDRHSRADHCGGFLRCAYASWHLHAVESAHGCLERRAIHSGSFSAHRQPAGARRSSSLPGQTVPQLPLHRRLRRPTRAGTGRHCYAHDQRPAHSSGSAGRRQHARLRQEPFALRSHRAGQLP